MTIARKFVILCTIIAGLLSGCQRSRELTNEDYDIVRLYLQEEPSSLDPRRALNRYSQMIAIGLFEGLTRRGENNIFEMALAESIVGSEDDLTYTIKLRPSKWSNGENVSAHDFVWAWRSLVDSKNLFITGYLAYFLKNGQQAQEGACPVSDIGVSAVDDATLHLSLERAMDRESLLEILANPVLSPICRTVAEKTARWAEHVETFVCNGPFVLKDRHAKVYLVLQKNPCYWNEKAPAQSKIISIEIVGESIVAYNKFLAGSIDWYGDPCGSMLLDAIKKHKTTVVSQPSASIFWLECNVNDPLLKSKKIRQAIASAINRDELCRLLLDGGGSPAFTIVPQEYAAKSLPTFEDNNISEARRLFDEGLIELGLSRQNLPPLSIYCLQNSIFVPVVEVIQQQLLDALDLKTQLLVLELGLFSACFVEGQFQLLSVCWQSSTRDGSYNLQHLMKGMSTTNCTGWNNTEYISLLNQGANISDQATRHQLLHRAEDIAMQELPIIPVYYKMMQYLKAPNIVGDKIDPCGDLDIKYLKRERPVVIKEQSPRQSIL